MTYNVFGGMLSLTRSINQPMLVVTSVTFISAADVKCGLYEINKNNRADAAHVLSLNRSDVGPERTRTSASTNRKLACSYKSLIE